MSRRLRRALLALLGLLAVLVLPVVAPASPVGRLVAAAPAGADEAVPSALMDFSDMVVAPGHLAISGCGSWCQELPDYDTGFGIEVTDALGGDPQIVPGVERATSLALAPGGATVWGLADGRLVSVPLDDPSASTAHPLPSGTCASDLAVAGDGDVWFSYGCAAQAGDPVHDLGVYDPATGALTLGLATELLGGPTGWPLILASTPTAPDTLVFGAPGAPGVLGVMTVAGNAIVSHRSRPMDSVTALAVAPDAASVLVAAAGTPRRVRLSDLRATATYGSDDWGDWAVAASDDGAYVATGGSDGIATYGPDSGQLLQSYPLPSCFGVAPCGLAWIGHALMTAKVECGRLGLHLYLRESAAVAPLTLTLTGPATAAINRPLALTGTLADRAETPVPGAALTVTRVDAVGTQTLAPVTTDAQGRFTVHDTPPNGLVATYTVAYTSGIPGTAATASFSTAIARYPTYVSISTDRRAYGAFGTAHVTAHLGGTYTGRMVSIYAVTADDGKSRLIAHRHVDGHGDVHVDYGLYVDTTFTVRFAGDARHLPAERSTRVTAQAYLSLMQLNYYDTSGHFRLYQWPTMPQFDVLFGRLNSHQCVQLAGETYSGGAWHAVPGSGCVEVDGNGEARWTVRGLTEKWQRYRYHVTWHGDAVNSFSTSAWRYFRFTD